MSFCPVQIPANYANACCGLAIDIGSALIKIIYIAEDQDSTERVKILIT